MLCVTCRRVRFVACGLFEVRCVVCDMLCCVLRCGFGLLHVCLLLVVVGCLLFIAC